jgi:hypothetical protein
LLEDRLVSALSGFKAATKEKVISEQYKRLAEGYFFARLEQAIVGRRTRPQERRLGTHFMVIAEAAKECGLYEHAVASAVSAVDVFQVGLMSSEADMARYERGLIDLRRRSSWRKWVLAAMPLS